MLPLLLVFAVDVVDHFLIERENIHERKMLVSFVFQMNWNQFSHNIFDTTTERLSLSVSPTVVVHATTQRTL